MSIGHTKKKKDPSYHSLVRSFILSCLRKCYIRILRVSWHVMLTEARSKKYVLISNWTPTRMKFALSNFDLYVLKIKFLFRSNYLSCYNKCTFKTISETSTNCEKLWKQSLLYIGKSYWSECVQIGLRQLIIILRVRKKNNILCEDLKVI